MLEYLEKEKQKVIMRHEINRYYMVTDNQRQYLFQRHPQQHPSHHEHHNHVEQRHFSNQNSIQRHQLQYQNVSQITKDCIHLSNPFEESLSTSPNSSSHSNMLSTYPERHSSTG